MDVSIIIINWNTCNLLSDCINSIYENAGEVKFEIIAVDNASEDGSCKMVRQFFPEVILIANSTNKGYAAAVNQGLKLAKGRYVLVLNSDIIICDQAIEKTVRYADNHPEAAVVGCKVMENDNKVHMTGRRFPSLLNLFLETSGLRRIFQKNRFFGREYMFWWLRDSEREVDIVAGMFMLVRHQAIDEVGPMDESFFFLFEETDWCYRFAKAGWKMLFWPGAMVIHFHGGGQSRKKAGVKIAMQFQKSMLIFFRKHFSWAEYFTARILLIINSFFSFLVWSILRLYKTVIRRDAQYQDAKMRLYWWSFWFCITGIEPGGKWLMRVLKSIMMGIKDGIETIFAMAYRVIALLFRRPPANVALYYHAMKQKDVAGFEKQMKYLADCCHVVKASDVMTASDNGTKPIVTIIFDDAFVSFRDNAIPILRHYGLSAAVAVPVGVMGKSPDWPMESDCDDKSEVVLNAKDIAELDHQDCEIMSHTVSHSNLTKISNDELIKELCESKHTLEQILGHEVAAVTYPYGACNSLVCKAAADAGYRNGFSVEPRTICQSANPLCIGRFKVFPNESMLRFKLKAHGAYRVAGFLRRFKRMLTGNKG